MVVRRLQYLKFQSHQITSKLKNRLFGGCISLKKMLFASFIDLISFSIHSYFMLGKEFLNARRTGERHSTMYDLSDISRLITLGDRNLNIAIKSSRVCLTKKRNLASSVIIVFNFCLCYYLLSNY